MFNEEAFGELVEKVKEKFPFEYGDEFIKGKIKTDSYNRETRKWITQTCDCFYSVYYNYNVYLHFLLWHKCMYNIFNKIYRRYKIDDVKNISIYRTFYGRLANDEDEGGSEHIEKLDRLPKQTNIHNPYDDITLEIRIDGVTYFVRRTSYYPSNAKDKETFCYLERLFYNSFVIKCTSIEMVNMTIFQEIQEIVIEELKKYYDDAVKHVCKRMLTVTKKSSIEFLEMLEILDKLYEIEGNKNTIALKVLMSNMKENFNIPNSDIEKFFYKIKAANHYIKYSPEGNK